MNEQAKDRMLDLLCKRVSEGLTDEEVRELEKLGSSDEERVELASLELTAASIAMSSVRKDETLPDHLKSAILADADNYFTEKRAASQPTVRETTKDIKSQMNIWGWLGWAAAAAACIALAVNIYQTRTNEIAFATPTPTPITQQPSPAQKREQLLASASDIVHADWGPGTMKDLAVGGDVVWSDTKQEGYLRFRDLPKNDNSVYTYQLWIFDETQDEKTPIDGGVFDVNAEGEIIVPIDAKLRARGAKAFAITMEKPGGVMVSKREKVVTLAAVKRNQA